MFGRRINVNSIPPRRLVTIVFAILVSTYLLWNARSFVNSFRTRPIDLHGVPGYPKDLPRARQVKARDIIHQNWTTAAAKTVPRIIHQSWEDDNIPAKWATWSDSWRVKHPGWIWVLWTNEDNRALVEARAPWLLDTYDALPGEIRRADVVRNLYMFFFGGVYADLDVECLRSHDDLFELYSTLASQGHSSAESPIAMFGRMGSDPNFRDSIPNAWMASSPGHPFFWLPLSYVVDHYQSHTGSVEALTGPIALRMQVNAYKGAAPDAVTTRVKESPLRSAYLYDDGERRPVPEKHEVVVLNEKLVFPYAFNYEGRSVKYTCEFNEFDFDPRRCQALLGTAQHGSYAITYWSHSWTADGHHGSHLQNAG